MRICSSRILYAVLFCSLSWQADIFSQSTELNQKTISYYDTHAHAFYERTHHLDLTPLYGKFLSYLKPGSNILDAGCGIGRDAHYFENHGYNVTAFDGSKALVKLANKRVKNPVQRMLFQNMAFTEEFDGVWACASLLHIADEELKTVLNKIHKALKPNGIFFASFKHGKGQITQENRTFYFKTEKNLRKDFKEKFSIVEIWTTEDESTQTSPSPDKMWINVLVRKI